MDVNKGELCQILRISRSTLDAWIVRYGDTFPIVEIGAHGREYRFNSQAVAEFLRLQQQEQEARKTERDEALAQLFLPLPDTVADGATLSLDDQLKVLKLNALRLAQAERCRQLVRSEEIATLLEEFCRAVGEHERNFISQIGREERWPEPIVAARIQQLGEAQHRLVDKFREFLRGSRQPQLGPAA